MKKNPQPAPGNERPTAVGNEVYPAVPRPSPATDPTNPFRQETCGIFAVNELATERRVDEPGLTESDRLAREPGFPPEEQ